MEYVTVREKKDRKHSRDRLCKSDADIPSHVIFEYDILQNAPKSNGGQKKVVKRSICLTELGEFEASSDTPLFCCKVCRETFSNSKVCEDHILKYGHFCRASDTTLTDETYKKVLRGLTFQDRLRNFRHSNYLPEDEEKWTKVMRELKTRFGQDTTDMPISDSDRLYPSIALHEDEQTQPKLVQTPPTKAAEAPKQEDETNLSNTSTLLKTETLPQYEKQSKEDGETKPSDESSKDAKIEENAEDSGYVDEEDNNSNGQNIKCQNPKVYFDHVTEKLYCEGCGMTYSDLTLARLHFLQSSQDESGNKEEEKTTENEKDNCSLKDEDDTQNENSDDKNDKPNDFIDESIYDVPPIKDNAEKRKEKEAEAEASEALTRQLSRNSYNDNNEKYDLGKSKKRKSKDMKSIKKRKKKNKAWRMVKRAFFYTIIFFF